MKFIIFAVLFFSIGAQAVCTRRPDPKRTVIFIDTNNGGPEVSTAREAACKRGDSFIMFPDASNGGTPNNTTEQLRTALTNLKAKGSAPVSLIISGHDGGGSYSGTQGSISRADITRLITNDFPEFKSSVESLYLLGCYTGVKYEVFSWMSAFPELKFIAGYEGSAPSSARVAGHSYIENLMLQEKQLINEATQARLQSDIERIPFMEQLTSSIVVRALQCEDPQTKKPTEFYYRSKPIHGDKMEILNSADCIEKVKAAAGKNKEFVKYFNGEAEVPTDTAGGPLRQLYNFYRSAEHCFGNDDDSQNPQADQVLGMLFYPGYSASIARYFENEVASLKRDLDSLTLETWKQTLDKESSEISEKVNSLESELAEQIRDPNAFKAKIDAKKKALDKLMTDISETPAGRAIFQFMDTHDVDPSELPSPPLDERTVIKVSDAFKQYENVYESPEDFKQSAKYKIESLNKRKEEIRNIERSEVKLQEIKNSWLPVKENIIGKTRKEQLAGLHKLYTLGNNTYGLPVETRKKAAALTKSFEKLMANVKCLPLSWHEAHNNPLEKPACGIVKPERMTGKITDTSQNSAIYLDYFNQNE